MHFKKLPNKYFEKITDGIQNSAKLVQEKNKMTRNNTFSTISLTWTILKKERLKLYKLSKDVKNITDQ